MKTRCELRKRSEKEIDVSEKERGNRENKCLFIMMLISYTTNILSS